MATRNDELLAYLQSLGLGNTQAPIEMAVPGFAQNFANYQAIPESAQYNPYAVSDDGSPYAQIMARMNSQNYAPSPYGGLLGPTNNGGYNPSIGSSLNQAVLDNYQGYSGVGGGAGGYGGSGTDANSFSNLTQAEQAAFYNANPTMSAITQAAQKGFNMTALGMALQGLDPVGRGEQAMIARGVDPAIMGQLNAAVQANAEAAAAAAAATAADSAAASAASASGTAPGSDGSPGSGAAKGGYIHAGMMFGANPPGPDDGAVNLDIGEYVIKKSSVNKYGRGLLEMINEGKVPAKKMKSLLG
jgi:hypothetical protein